MNRFALTASLLFVVCVARDSAAQTFINPFVGTTLSSPSPTGSSSKPGFGVAFGTVRRFVGAETEIAYYPQLLDNTSNGLAKNKVVTFSGNTLIGPTIHRAKIYGSFGFGDLYLNVTSAQSVFVPNPTSLSTNYFTFNGGAGVMGFFAKHFGARVDVRYYKAFGFKVTDLQSEGLTLDKFNFWRANVGLVIKF